jgi:hypothetical protein
MAERNPSIDLKLQMQENNPGSTCYGAGKESTFTDLKIKKRINGGRGRNSKTIKKDR